VNDTNSPSTTQHSFKAETRQLLDILAHSLYTNREIFLRELISNASDALTRLDFEMLTNREVLDPDTELAIRIIPNEKERTLTVIDSGIGMTADELIDNLGTIAHSGARAFVAAAREAGKSPSDIIGQFGVGFYSTFMVAEWIKVNSRSYKPDSEAGSWYSTGGDSFSVEQSDKGGRGTEVIVKLKDDAGEFLQEYRLREIIRRHSDFIPFPIYLGEGNEQINRQTAIWRQQPRQVEQKDYDDFYRQLTLEPDPPLVHAHMVVDAPVQMYALLYVPMKYERGLFSMRRDDGLKLYSHKVLIQEYCKDLLPEYLRFVQGIVDSEDLPLNISRETVQSNRIMAQLKKLVTSKVIESLKKLAQEKPEVYHKFWEGFGRFIKEGVAIEVDDQAELYPLLLFRTTQHLDSWSSLEDYTGRMKPEQKAIYYLLGDDIHSAVFSPHLDLVKQYDYEVLILTEPVDPFMLARLTKYKEVSLENVATSKLEPLKKEGSETDVPSPGITETDYADILARFKAQLGDRVSDVRMTERLAGSPARLADPEGAPNPELQRVYHYLKEDFNAPKKVLELNPRHAILVGIKALPEESELSRLIIEQVYEDALLVEGLHPDPVGMVPRIQKLMEAALKG
jgi:molecular chaperone HtpG